MCTFSATQRDGGFDERLVTQLLHNYRSLPSILKTYSEMSYESKLIANISDEDSAEQRLLANVQANIDPSVKLQHTPKQGVYFIGVVGRDETVADSTSWRNSMEVHEVSILTMPLQLRYLPIYSYDCHCYFDIRFRLGCLSRKSIVQVRFN